MSAKVRHSLGTLRLGMSKLAHIDLDNLRAFEIDSLEIGGTKLSGVKVDSSDPLDVAAFTRVLATLRANRAADAAAEAATDAALR
jgi:hypothetical protein